MAKKGNRILISLECSSCKERNYQTERNRINRPEPLELKKYCSRERKVTLHKEIK